MDVRTQKVHTKTGRRKGRRSSNNTIHNDTTPKELNVYYRRYHHISETSKKMEINGINESMEPSRDGVIAVVFHVHRRKYIKGKL